MTSHIQKFYIASFLKNQIYFVPILIIFFQELNLNFSQIFWIFTLGSLFSFLIEIPTGLIADIYGKKRSILFSKFLIFLSFIFFGLSFNFISILIANLIYELGKSFRSGTETAYIYDYLAKYSDLSYTEVKGKQKFYARISESIGTAVGGFIVIFFGFNWVFFIASVPAFLNFVLTFFWKEFEDKQKKKLKLKEIFKLSKNSLKEVYSNFNLLKLIINITIFTSIFAALDKFIQPYMLKVGIEIEYFGLIYSSFLLLAAFLVKYSYLLEKKFGDIKLINILSLITVIPILILGFGYVSLIGVFLFFFVLIVENIRSPIANTLFHSKIKSENRSTMGSILELFKSSGKLIILPIAGYLTDSFSMSITLLFLAIIILINAILFWIVKKT